MHERIQKVIEKWTNENEVLLRAGDMTVHERDIVMSVLRGFARDLRSVYAGGVIDSISAENIRESKEGDDRHQTS
jgi:hypothetical protein